VRPARHEQVAAVVAQRGRARKHDVDVDDVRDVNPHLAHDVVEPKQVEGIDGKLVATVERRALAEDQPGSLVKSGGSDPIA